MEKVEVLIVEDEPLVAEDIAGHLESLDFTVSAIAHSGEEALEFLSDNEPDVALLDITLAGDIDGIEVAHYINKNNRIPFIFLTSHADRGTIEMVKETRPGGYLVKPFDENDLLTSIEMALSNYLLLHPRSEDLTLEWTNKHLSNPLSDREFDILMAMKSGKTNAELAETLFLSVNTIKTHLQNIYSKMDVKNRTEAMFKINEMLKKG
ncbi:MAG: response regulator transcription factor [Flavobacteriales bacterium]|nr:response regulator transcription factor [Flavobacteriales bacterium]NNK81347.1 response regulator transcription factor [Flavobacteriales bacterium]